MEKFKKVEVTETDAIQNKTVEIKSKKVKGTIIKDIGKQQMNEMFGEITGWSKSAWMNHAGDDGAGW